MNTRGIIGKRIVAVRQVRFSDQQTMKTNVVHIELEDGTRLIPITVETETGDYAHDFAVNVTERKR